MTKKALVTGFSSGIGLAYSKHLANDGWKLDLVSKNKDRSKKSEMILNYDHAHFHNADLSKKESVTNIVAHIDTPDLIIANAGIAINGAIGKLNDLEKKEAYYLMCGGVIDLIEGFMPEMIERGSGRIVIISSIGAITAMPKSSIYSSIKSGIYAYGKSISVELRHKGINVTVSLPGYVRTNAHKRAGLDHLEKKVPKWMWVSAETVVKETEKASIAGRSEVIPGIVYRITKPFLKFQSAVKVWQAITKRNQ